MKIIILLRLDWINYTYDDYCYTTTTSYRRGGKNWSISLHMHLCDRQACSLWHRPLWNVDLSFSTDFSRLNTWHRSRNHIEHYYYLLKRCWYVCSNHRVVLRLSREPLAIISTLFPAFSPLITRGAWLFDFEEWEKSMRRY